MKYIYTTLLSMSLILGYAQQTTETSDLKKLETTFKERFEIEKQQAEAQAPLQQVKLRYTYTDGTVLEFAGYDAAGQMLYNKTSNIGSGRTISTNKVWPGGTVGTSLTGANLPNRLGEWDGGAVRITHREFGGRVIQADGATGIIDHATHVAGTMIASGVSPNAKGMSYAATLKAYDWNNDESEMAAAATAGMLLSNHSYGTIAGWNYNSDENRWEWYGEPTISATEDWKFGFYDQQAADWDNIAFNAPNYLICKSAGNDRGDMVTGGNNHFVRNSNGLWVASTVVRNMDGNALGYDCIPTNGVSKNILTVGAVNKIGNSNSNNGYVNAAGVVMSSFSGWGPTDDGRIKPDVVAAGVDLYSSFSAHDSDYSTISGTSMSSPSVTGSLLLVQQHYSNLKGKFMRATSLKALMIHTADEAGAASGPDYKFGWGLINIAKAVQLITDSNYNQIQERTLASGATFNQGIASDGSVPLRVTICWADKPGTPVATALNPTTRMLVNDLDIRVTKTSDNSVSLPWVLDPTNPAAAATKADNTRDNVEQILIPNPTAGTYTITVSHKGTLINGAAQNYSLIVSGIIGKPAASFSANILPTICTGKTIVYMDNSGGNPTSRNWYFPGGTPSTSTAATVAVTYNSIGNFPVSLKIANSIGADSVYNKDYVKVGGLKLPFMETFESNSPTLNDWSVSNGITNTDTDTTKWRLATINGTTPGNTAYCMPSFYYTSTNKKDLLLSPPLNFYGFKNVVLKFNHAYVSKNGRSDSLRIYISDNCGNTWIPVTGTDSIIRTAAQQNNTSFVPASAASWCLNCYAIDLSAYDGLSNLRLRFETTSSFGNNVYIDNIAVTGEALVPAAQFGTGNPTVCAGNPVAFADSSTNNPTKWKWTFTGAVNVADTNQNPVVSWDIPGVYDVKLVVSNSGGADSLTQTSYITVLPSPAKPNVTASATGMCIGDSVLLATDSSATGFMWYRDHILLSNNTSQYYALLAGTYQVSLVGSNGCATGSAEVKLESGPKPDVPSITSNIVGSSFCDGGTASLISTATTGNQWYKNNAPINGEINKILTTQAAGTYFVKTTVSGCVSDASNSLSYTLKPKPVTSAITGNANAKFNSDEVYSITPTNGSTYNWTVTNGTPSNGTAPGSINVTWGTTTTGNVSVKETGSNGCIGDAQNLAVNLTPNSGLNSIGFAAGLKIFPNPMTDVVGITFSQGTMKPATLKIVNMLGQTIWAESLKTITAGYSHTIDVSELNGGVYFIEVSTMEGTAQVKVIKK